MPQTNFMQQEQNVIRPPKGKWLKKMNIKYRLNHRKKTKKAMHLEDKSI